MEIGIDDIDFVDDVVTEGNDEPTVTPDEDVTEGGEEPQQQEEENNNTQQEEDKDFLTTLLESRGIQDRSKIKFENEDGEIEEVDWDNLDNDAKMNILQSSESTDSDSLDQSEIQLINAIRNSGMTPSEYLDYMGKEVVNRYIQNSQQPQYSVDQYTDDELYLMDLMSRTGDDLTEDEAIEALDKAKSNESLYKKQVDAIRKEYQEAEKANQAQAELEEQQAQQQQFEQFSNQIVDEINNLKEVQGFELNMDSDDMQTLYDFITGQDAAGNNYFAKALSDPKILVKAAWLILNGDQMVNDITNYFQKEITEVRKNSYKKGAEEAKKKSDSNVIFKSKGKNNPNDYDDLDDF